MEKRMTYLDMAKGIGIVMVVIGHLFGALQTIDNKTYFSPIYHVIASFHMPLFFFISGVLIHITGEENRRFADTLRRKTKALFTPYVTFSVIYLVMNIVVRILMPKLVEETFIWEIFWNSLLLRGVSVLWFLPALYFAELLFLLTKKKMQEKKMVLLWSILGTLMLLLTPIFRWGHWEDHWILFAVEAVLHTMVRSIICTMLLMIGYYLWPVLQKGKEKSALGFLAGAGMMIAFGALSFANESVDLNYLAVGNPLLYVICAVGSSLGLLLLCKNGPQVRLLIFYGVNSLIIMCTHMEFQIMKYSIEFSYWINKFVTRAKEPVLFATIWLSITVLEAIFIWLFNRYFYFLIGKHKPVGSYKGEIKHERE